MSSKINESDKLTVDKERIKRDKKKYGSVTKSEAVWSYFISKPREQDLSYIRNCPEDKLERLYSNYCPFFMRVCKLKENKTLRVRCGGGVDIPPKKAAQVLVKALWKDMQGTPIDQLDKLDIRVN